MFKRLSYDGHGINDTDEYRTRAAAFNMRGMSITRRDELGHLFAAAPDLLAALVDLVNRADTSVLADGSSLDTLAAHVAIARAAGRPFPTDPE